MKNPEITLYRFVLEKARGEKPERQAEVYRALAVQIHAAPVRDQLHDLADQMEEAARRAEALQMDLFSAGLTGTLYDKATS